MPDKISNNEIKKALECLSGEQIFCRECKYSAHLSYRECQQAAANDALDLINRLEAEKEVLEARIGIYETCNARKDEAIRTLEDKCEELQAVIVKYNSNLAKQVAENERLGITANSYKKMYEDIQHLEIKVDKIKDLPNYHSFDAVEIEVIYDTLKELVGEKE